MKNNQRKTENRGFSLAEVLVVIAIIGILGALIVPNIAATRKKLRQRELDAKAELIYSAAQNQMIKLRVGGNATAYAGAKAIKLSQPPQDSSDTSRVLYYMTSLERATEDRAAHAVMTSAVVDDALLSRSWVIEYEPESGGVYAVFYSEDDDFNIASEYGADWYYCDILRDQSERIKLNKVGYYGGDINITTSSTSTLEANIRIINEEKLIAYLQCTAPLDPADPTKVVDVVFTVELEDTAGNKCTVTYDKVESNLNKDNCLHRSGKLFYCKMVLDDLSSEATRFNAVYGQARPDSSALNITGDKLNAGTELKIWVTASPKSNKMFQSSHKPELPMAITNSLFDYKEDHSDASEALIGYGRHLQNLDGSSGVTGISCARQVQNISFARDEYDDTCWHAYYSGKYFYQPGYFKPIQNSDFTGSYDGDSHSIVGLNTKNDAGGAGLFESFGGKSIEGLTLTGTKVSASGAAGALAGEVTHAGTIKNCRVYLDPAVDLNGKTEKNIWIGGQDAGGLVGVVSETGSSSLKIENSFASTVLRGSACAGGLAGKVSEGAKLELAGSYADSYISGAQLGGLVGSGPVESMTDCYAAGFLTASGTSAGLVNGRVGSAGNSYTICAREDDDMSSPYYSTAHSIGGVTAGGVYYFLGGTDAAGTSAINNMTSEELFTKLGGAAGAFQTDTSDTVPYRLKGQALEAYPYPRLKENIHYGDWQAKFHIGALVYYEAYQDGTYGFYGANLPTSLSVSKTVVGDGYGVVYAAEDAKPASLSAVIDSDSANPFALDVNTFYKVTSDGKEYEVYPLPKELTNRAPAASDTGFYRRLTVTADALSETYRFNPFFAKTAFQMNDASAALPALNSGDLIYVRTPRHLYGMSLYYDDHFAAATKRCTYTQERAIDYSTYDWNDYALVTEKAGFVEGGVVVAQEPIGAREPGFLANYNGGCYVISRVSFISGKEKDTDYIGMFGYNTGELYDIVLATDYVPDGQSGRNYYVQRLKDMYENDNVYMGVLAGYNAPNARIRNCAVAGYYLAGSDGTLHAYQDSTLYAGGLVGGNSGSITNSAADCPTINVVTLYAHAYVGGFVGWNQGAASNCYAIGHIEADGGWSEDAVHVAGFAGSNGGSVSSSYCATSIITSRGAESHGFAPKTGGFVTGCSYLDKGTYAYAGTLHIYSASSSDTAGSPIYLADLQGTRAYGMANAGNSYYHKNTENGDIHAYYPYRAVVRNRNGAYVHYGDWQDAAAMGTSGVFYWEHEEEGSNSGYHFAFVGTQEGIAVAGTTLCTAHDDGGVITDFGYGYYVIDGQEKAFKFQSENIAVSSGGDTGDNVYNGAAKSALEKQVAGYVFYPYTTRTADEAGEGRDYVYLTAKDNGKQNIAAGTWTLTYTAEGGAETAYSYEVAPFFANAMRLNITTELGGYDVHALDVTASDGSETDYRAEPGSKTNRYEIRSARQLQYINWNWGTQSTDQLVTANAENYKRFTYLMYTSSTGQAKQTLDNAGNNTVRYWYQTHDADGGKITDYVPIAGAATSSAVGSYNSVLYAWFGGHYDGQSYKIQDLSITSDSFSVGVFGMTAGANINNVILYGKNSPAVERKTPNAVKGNTQVGAYSMGALIGVAYDYYTTQNNVRVTDNVITNCAVAGYRIIDSSTNQQGVGDANVGGLIGVANVKLERCSAVVDIDIQCTHDLGHAQYGSYIRAGGLTGASQFTVTDCYTGGKITVAQKTVDEFYDNSGNNIGIEAARAATEANPKLRYSRDKNTHIYAAGVTACAFSCNYINFTGTTGRYDGRVALSNCYTYMRLPDMEGTIKGVSLIGGPGDRYGQANNNAEKDKGTTNYGTCAIVNSYYLQGVTDQVSYTAPGYYFSQGKDPTYEITEDEFRNKILFGDLHANNFIVNPHNNANYRNYPDPAQIKAISYDELSGSDMLAKLSSSSWGWVTTVEANGATINGKYSFPGGNGALTGKNYPFPTVVRQNDLTYGTVADPEWVNVHYGEWPQNGCYWEGGRTSIDVFADMVGDAEAAAAAGYQPDCIGYAVKTFKLYDQKNQLGGTTLTAADFSFSVDKVVALVGEEFDPQEPDETGYRYYNIPFKALKDSAVTVTMTHGEATASFNLSLTGNLTVGSNAPDPFLLYKGVSDKVTLTATSKDGTKDFSLSGEWTLAAAETADANLYEITVTQTKQSEWTVISTNPGSRVLEATFVYDYHGYNFSAKGFIQDHTLGVIGLSDGESYSQMWRVEAGSANGGGLDDSLEKPVAPLGSDFFLYETRSDGMLSKLVIDGVTVTENAEDGQSYIYQKSDDQGNFQASGDPPYQLYISPTVVTDSNYEYRVGTLFSDGTGASGTVTIEITAHYDMTSGTDEGGNPITWQEPYTLHLTIENVSTFRVVLKSGLEAAANSMRLGIHEDDGGKLVLTLPECPFTRTGYTFAGWLVVKDDNEALTITDDGGNKIPVSFAEGEAIAITKTGEAITGLVRESDGTEIPFQTEHRELTLAASWTAGSYAVDFDANGGAFDEGFPTDEEQAALANVSYDVDFALPKIEYVVTEGEETFTKYHITRPGYVFSGWNTETGGTGKDYADGAIVRNLATGGKVTLYAQWASMSDLTLESTHFADGLKKTFTVVPGSTLLAGYTVPAWDGYTLDGWYTAADETGEKVLNADGGIAAAVAGYTIGSEGSHSFQMSANKPLYARWTTEAFAPVTTLGHKGPETDDFTQYNGTYLVVSEAGAGNRYALADTVDKGSTESLITLTAEPVTVLQGMIIDESGELLTDGTYIIDNGNDTLKWTVTYQNYLDGYLAFSFKNSATDRCLYWDTTKNEPAKVKTGLKETENDAQWSYNMRYALRGDHQYCLESRRWVSGGGGDSVGWSNGAFRRQRGGLAPLPVYLYKQQTISIFE